MSSSVKRAFQIVDFIAERQGKVRQIDIINELKMKKATVHRYFDTLEKLNIIEKKEHNYYLGFGLLVLGNKVQSKDLIINRIKVQLDRIVEELNETLNVAQLNSNIVKYLHKVESTRNLQFKAAIGDNLPFHCTGLGKSILSLLGDDEIKKLVKINGLKKYTNNTITDEELLFKQINQIRVDGYAIEMEEFEEGLVCVSIPFEIKKYNFTGAISFSGTSNRLDKEGLVKIITRAMPFIDKLKKMFEE